VPNHCLDPGPHALGQTSGFGDGGVQINLAMHGVGSVIVIALVLLPSAHE